MRKIRDVLRLKLDARLSHEQIARSLGISKGVVAKYVRLAAAAGLDWPAVQTCDDTALERQLLAAPQRPRGHVVPDYGRVHQELRKKSVTLMLLWEECNLLQQYLGGNQPANTTQVEQHFDQVARNASQTSLGNGVAEALRSDHTPPFGDMVGQLFGNGNAQQRAGMLNQLIAGLGPSVLASLGGGLGSNAGGGGLGNILGGVVGRPHRRYAHHHP